ncbi:MAG TPA: hypothetical protein PKA55_09925 [Rhodoblastus sp.]|nr:hypothetical protein [Rhodoblastus sp.]
MAWIWSRLGRGLFSSRLPLRYFQEILPVEFDEINERRAAIDARAAAPADAAIRAGGGPGRRPRGPVAPLRPGQAAASFAAPAAPHAERPLPTSGEATGDPEKPDRDKTRWTPAPANLTGLSLSGGGIRSAALCLGALQSLKRRKVIDSLDYLSTVSGGGYIGAAMTAATSANAGQFPFGEDVSDSPVVGHLRNYSNYLLPRGRSSLRNFGEAAAILIRGPLLNALMVLSFLLWCAFFTLLAYPQVGELRSDGFALAALTKIAASFGWETGEPAAVHWFPRGDFRSTLVAVAATAGWLAGWALYRSVVYLLAKLFAALAMLDLPTAWRRRLLDRSATLIARQAGDTAGIGITVSFWLVALTVVMAVLDLQPIVLYALNCLYGDGGKQGVAWLQKTIAFFSTLSGVVAVASSLLGNFLKATEQNADIKTGALRVAVKILVLVAAAVLPALLWLSYLFLSLWGMDGSHVKPPAFLDERDLTPLYGYTALCLTLLALLLRPNAYSLHRFYRDRLAKAFFVAPDAKRPLGGDLHPLDKLKLSDIRPGAGPYHLINAAMNVQGSSEANRRGRGADFFVFSRNFIGSDLTLYARTRSRRRVIGRSRDMEAVDPQLDLATAMAISGAAVSANMGVNTMRALSPTLALLNIRLGYWLRNPRDVARRSSLPSLLEGLLHRVLEKFYLVAEMFNALDEKSAYVFLTDGGHIENLGVYELLKRGCQLIVVVDAEADRSMAFPSLLRLERYARIDLGVRIVLPWEEIAMAMQALDEACDKAPARIPERKPGPHCAVGRICYADGAQGVLVYFKSSLSGDEKDYILDYKRRNPAFPHETTGDQFFSEEQFECYRALGFHIVDGFFAGDHQFSWLEEELGGWSTSAEAMREVQEKLALA